MLEGSKSREHGQHVVQFQYNSTWRSEDNQYFTFLELTIRKEQKTKQIELTLALD